MKDTGGGAGGKDIASLGKPLALGRTAEIYAWGEGRVLKLFYDWVSPGSARYEADQARRVLATGQPAPAVWESVEIGGRTGLVYDRVDGETLLRRMLARPWRFAQAARLLAALHAEMHSRPGEGLPSQKMWLEERLRQAGALDENLRAALLERLRRLPEGRALCHGDFHPENIQMTASGPVVIDWVNASCGDPLGDVARTLLLVGFAVPAGGAPRLLDLLRRRFRQVYLQRYRQLAGSFFDEARLRAWLSVTAGARLQEKIAGETEQLLCLAASAAEG